jgi:5-methylcytosine-specific restriction protein A
MPKHARLSKSTHLVHHEHTKDENDPEHNSKRSGHWNSVKKAFLRQHAKCAACGKAGKHVKLNVHHQIPFHYVTVVGRPELELETENLITLCVEHDDQHHLLLGHLDNFKSYNPDVLTDVKKYWNYTREKIMKDREYRIKKRKRPPNVTDMSTKQKAKLREYLDKRFPDSGIHDYTRAKKRQRKDLHLAGHYKHEL